MCSVVVVIVVVVVNVALRSVVTTVATIDSDYCYCSDNDGDVYCCCCCHCCCVVSGPRYLPQRRQDGFVLGQRGGPLPDHLHGDGRQREVGLHAVRGDLGGSQGRGRGERNQAHVRRQ